MNNNLWDQDRLQQYITDEIEENLNLDYKAAGALSKNDNKKTEITKDVSAMANSAGGIIIYGIKEYQEKAKKYLPESIDPINRNDISKEWLEQIINNIQPKISGIIIHPVKLDLGDDTVAYVVEIPQSTTAHQAQDKKYYKRFNFSSEPMDDYEIRDIINRAVKPDIEVEIKPKYLRLTKDNRHTWGIEFEITNLSPQVINHFQIVLSIPGINRLYTKGNKPLDIEPKQICELRVAIHALNIITVWNPDNTGRQNIAFRFTDILFPEETITTKNLASITIYTVPNFYEHLDKDAINIDWIAYADDMTPKKGTFEVISLLMDILPNK